MIKYRIKLKAGLTIDFILIQEKKWYGWKTVARMVQGVHTVRDAKSLIEDMKRV